MSTTHYHSTEYSFQASEGKLYAHMGMA